MLAAGLTALLPGSRVVGEEAAFEDPMLLDTVGMPGDVWLVDPVDGTANFAAGRGTVRHQVVALLRDGVIMASWIYQPVTQRVRRWPNGAAGLSSTACGAKAPTTVRPPGELRCGPSFWRHFLETIRRGVEQARTSIEQILPGCNCAGVRISGGGPRRTAVRGVLADAAVGPARPACCSWKSPAASPGASTEPPTCRADTRPGLHRPEPGDLGRRAGHAPGRRPRHSPARVTARRRGGRPPGSPGRAVDRPRREACRGWSRPP